MLEKSLTNISKSKANKKLIVASLILLLTFSTAAAFMQTANAHTPPWTITTYGYVTAAPNPAGIGSPVAIVFWLMAPPPTAGSPTSGDRWRNEMITVTKPDGKIVKLGPFNSDPVGSNYCLYTPDIAGTYNVTFNFPGQVLGLTHPTTNQVGVASNYVNDTYLPCSATASFTTTTEPTKYFVEAPFPVSYWTRPINENNQLWTAIASNWLGSNGNAALFGATYQKFNPYGWAPGTAHVMWTYPLSWGGMVGGDNAISDTMSFYSGTQYNLKFSYPIIMYGNVYFSLPRGTATTGNGVTCVNLRTGETVWTNPDLSSVSFGQFYDWEDPNQHGTSGVYLWAQATVRGTGLTSPNWNNVKSVLSRSYNPGEVNLGSMGTTSNSTYPVNTQGWVGIDPSNGKLAFNLTDIPSGTQCYGPRGEWLQYGIGRAPGTVQGTNVPFTYLWQWNNTRMQNGFAGSTSGNYNMSASYDWNVTLDTPLYPTFSSIGSYGGAFAYSAYYNATTGLYTNNPTILRVFPGNLIMGQSSGLQQSAATSAGVFGTPDPFTLWAINLNATRGTIGHVMWQKTYPAPPGNLTVLIGPGNAETNTFVIYYRETIQWTGFNMLTGEQIWGPTPSENNWNFYGGTTGLTNPYGVGYGHLYSAGYSGTLYAYDLRTGHLDFTYGNDANNPNNSTITTETTYGDFPTQVAAIANNKVYLVEEEHSLNAPAYHGAMTRCVDAFSGKELWKIYGICSWQQNAVADGYYTWLNLNELQIYCIGPGPSSTSVTSNPGVVPLGSSALVTGKVLDQSPNTKLKGTPAISDADQGPWMEYMVQSSIARPNVKGVPVTVTAIDPSGALINIGTVDSDLGGTFGIEFKPTMEGKYDILATFAGSDSYGSSYDTTYLIVGPAASAAPTAASTPTPLSTVTPTLAPTTSATIAPEPGTNTATIMYVAIAAVAIIVVIAAVAVLLRRRK